MQCHIILFSILNVKKKTIKGKARNGEVISRGTWLQKNGSHGNKCSSANKNDEGKRTDKSDPNECGNII